MLSIILTSDRNFSGEFPAGNTFGATVYIAYSGLWASLALILSPWSGVATFVRLSFLRTSAFDDGLSVLAPMLTRRSSLMRSDYISFPGS